MVQFPEKRWQFGIMHLTFIIVTNSPSSPGRCVPFTGASLGHGSAQLGGLCVPSVA
jgi:hypothetical protein